MKARSGGKPSCRKCWGTGVVKLYRQCGQQPVVVWCSCTAPKPTKQEIMAASILRAGRERKAHAGTT